VAPTALALGFGLALSLLACRLVVLVHELGHATSRGVTGIEITVMTVVG
jgi:hypothetical protein